MISQIEKHGRDPESMETCHRMWNGVEQDMWNSAAFAHQGIAGGIWGYERERKKERKEEKRARHRSHEARYQEYYKIYPDTYDPIPLPPSPVAAAAKVQKVYRGHRTRKEERRLDALRRQKHEEDLREKQSRQTKRQERRSLLEPDNEEAEVFFNRASSIPETSRDRKRKPDDQGQNFRGRKFGGAFPGEDDDLDLHPNRRPA